MIKRQRQVVAMASAKWLQEIQSVIINHITVNNAIISCMSTTSIKDEENELFLLYFKVVDDITEADHQAALHPGRGHQCFGIREPNNPLPLIPVCRVYIADPNRFRSLCGLNPDEFADLLAVVKEQMLQPRNGFCEFDDQQQSGRKPRPNGRKLQPDEELFVFLYYMRCYPNKGFAQMETIFGWAHSAADSSFRHLLRIFAHNTTSPLVDEITWPSDNERQRHRDLLRAAGIPESFLVVVGFVDGVKQLKNMNIKNQQQSKEYNQKGVGRNHLVWVDWFGKIIRVECGFQGSENDRGMYNCSDFSGNYNLFLNDDETVGGDAIFQGPKGAGSRGLPISQPDVFAPFNIPALRQNPNRKLYNRLMHRYRVVVEQSIGSIKQWKSVSIPYRGGIEDQAFFWLVASRLTAYLMRVRNKYPRGENFLKKELEEWEEELGEFLWYDLLFPDLYF